MNLEANAYPLCWPAGHPRTPVAKRQSGTFKGTLDAVRNELLDEVDRLIHGKVDRDRWCGAILSTNMPLRRDGGINASAGKPCDPGVALYFQRNGKDYCFACDTFDAVWKNIRALHRTLEAIRSIERYGSVELMNRAFDGFLALPAPKTRHWSDVLDLSREATLEEIKQRFRAKARAAHPDAGGNADDFAELTAAHEAACKERGAA